MFFIPYGFLLEEHPDEITDYLKRCLEFARNSAGIEVAKSWIEVEKISEALLDFFKEYDLLLTPTIAVPSPCKNSSLPQESRLLLCPAQESKASAYV